MKADVIGSLEALQGSLEMIESDKVLLEILQGDVGQVTKNDIKMAKTSGADVIGFNVKLENGVMGEAKYLGVQVFQNSIIYEIIDLIKDNMADLLEAETVEKKDWSGEIRQVFRVSVAGLLQVLWLWKDQLVENKGARLLRDGDLGGR